MKWLFFIGLPVLALLGYNSLQVKQFVKQLDYQITGFRLPKIQNGTLSFPVTLEFLNPTEVAMRVNSLVIRLYKMNDQQWDFIGSTEEKPQAFTILANGPTAIDLIPSIFTEKINLVSELLSFLSTKAAPKFMVEIDIKLPGFIHLKKSQVFPKQKHA